MSTNVERSLGYRAISTGIPDFNRKVRVQTDKNDDKLVKNGKT